MTIKEWTDEFGDNLMDLLRDRHMTQYELAKASGLSPGSISSYVNKQSQPSVKAILNMACALDIDVAELIDFGDCID